MAAREISATTGETVESRVAGYAVETLRRARFGDEVARLAWSAESSLYSTPLTRQGSVVVMLRSRDGAEATRAYEDYARQAETRAALLQGRTAAGPCRRHRASSGSSSYRHRSGKGEDPCIRPPRPSRGTP